MKQKINSIWVKKTGRWTDPPGEYRDIKAVQSTKEIEMEIVSKDGNPRPVLLFHGGPTGYENYFIDSLLKNPIDSEKFCICAGTINSWPSCTVNAKEVFDFLEENGYK